MEMMDAHHGNSANSQCWLGIENGTHKSFSYSHMMLFLISAKPVLVAKVLVSLGTSAKIVLVQTTVHYRSP